MDQDIRPRYRTPKQSRRPAPPSDRLTNPKPAGVAAHKPIQNIPDKLQPRAISFEPAHPANRKYKKRRLLKIFLIVIVLVGVGATGKIWAYPKLVRHTHTPFSTAILSKVSFPVFYPERLPGGYVVDTYSMQATQNGLVYNANNESSRLVFTQQKVPAGFDFTSFYSKHLTDITQFDTAYGQATIGKNDDRNLGSLVTDKTWLLLTTNSRQPSVSDMSLILKNLKQY
jgi:hypothetical protein